MQIEASTLSSTPTNHYGAPHAWPKMPRYSIYPESLVAPNQFSPYLSVSFRRGVESRDPIFPASGLQLSFERPDCQQEIFVERITARDVQSSESGLCTVSLPKDDMPKYAVRKGLEDTVCDVVVKLHAWKGERHLGAWEVGKLSGADAYKVVA